MILETAGESHGPRLTAILVGIPAGAPVTAAFVDARLAARQRGYGRGGRQKIEQDRARFDAGVRDGRATGNPIALVVENRDTTYASLPPVHAPRPGHADLAGAMNRGVRDARDVVERASARETAVRVAAGAVAAE
ncbi:MAG TPA: chorismate synthase, partial [Planctomycetota bacterium]|nr:chorismate synthase [Planctomycetota bacterium]